MEKGDAIYCMNTETLDAIPLLSIRTINTAMINAGCLLLYMLWVRFSTAYTLLNVRHPPLFQSGTSRSGSSMNSSTKVNESSLQRRNLFTSILPVSFGTFFPSPSSAIEMVDDDLTRGGVKLNAFNSLTFNYRGTNNRGLDASKVSEPSISYSDFLTQLDAGDIDRVEFYAPNGDVAYAILKNGGRIRIGEGFPVENSSGWSSPTFVMKTLRKRGVPFKFIF